MKLLNKLRNKTFWLVDNLKGNPVKKDLNDIRNSFDLLSFNLLQKKNAPILKKLLDTAVNSTKFYRDYKLYKSLEDFPVINKLIIKNNFDAINILPNSSKNIVKVGSSGSTGEPFEVYQTKRKRLRNKADVIFFAETASYTIGDQILFVRLWVKKYKKSFLHRKLLNMVEIDVLDDLKDETKIKKIISNLKKTKQSKGFIGYPSGFESICEYLDKEKAKPLDCNIKSIIATSEALPKNVRDKMAYYFKSDVVSRYSNEENGIISQQMINEDSFTINWASFYIEILDLKEDKPTAFGKLGRIVVTDLYNLATPLIRYDTGDLGKFCDFENDGIPKFEIVTGRLKDVLYDTRGAIVNPFLFYDGLIKYPEIDQFQIIQKSKTDYIFKINIETSFIREKEFVNYFKSYLGNDSNIFIEYVSDIPLLNSGKRRTIINLHNA